MAISKQDRNTAVTIAIVLIVCTITLVALVSFLWQIMAPGVQRGLQELDLIVFKLRSDYNFTLPEKT